MKNVKRLVYLAATGVICSILTIGCQSNRISENINNENAILTEISNADADTIPGLPSDNTECEVMSDTIIDTAGNSEGNQDYQANGATKIAVAWDGIIDGYADTDYSIIDGIDMRYAGVDYGMLISNVNYYSTTINENKQCSVLLPAGYDTSQRYPVIYFLHGFGGDHTVWFGGDDQLRNTYGNMIYNGMASPAVVVTVDMYTAPASEYEESSEDEKRVAYDAFVNDLLDNLMPFIEATYSVKTGRDNTAIIGESQGATESLAIGFLEQDKFGYIGSLAPCAGVIPTEFNLGTFWNIPIMNDFVIDNGENMPYYIQLAVGDQDDWCYEPTIYYDEILTAKEIPHVSYVVEGVGHDSDLWENGIYNFIKRIF